MKIKWDNVASGPFPDHGEGDKVDTLADNQECAQIVLRNWIAAASWGLPRSMVAEMLAEEESRIRSQASG